MANAVIALVDDLMDRSRVTAALPGVRFARSVAEVAGADVVIVDLARHAGHVRAVREQFPDARIVAFGPHVDEDAASRARLDGADLVLPRSRFFQDPAAAANP
ncbi:MAG: hypothetical protein JWL83_2629 [Actinomycetia bacterium]|jgi:hypothetical protein|nr:hypothetical protein [Actinomycetes bacterium]